MTDVQNPPGGASAGGLPDAAIAAPVVEAPGQSTGLVLVPPSAVAVVAPEQATNENESGRCAAFHSAG